MLWRPNGVQEHDAARWDAYPERSTYFLQIIANEKREGRFMLGNPTNAHYNLLIKSFWERLHVYHTKAQFKNHFAVKKQLWSLLSWVQNKTGIQWDDERKMVIASAEWWEANKDRKGLSALRDKSVPDYDLLEFVYRGQHADGTYMCDPREPRWPRPEGVGETEPVEAVQISDNEDISTRPATAARRQAEAPPSQPTRKRNRRATPVGVNSSPVVEQMNEIMGSFFERMESLKSRRDVGVTRSPESVAMPNGPAFGSYADVVRVLLDEMNVDLSSELFYDAQEMFLQTPVVWEAFLRLPTEKRWVWLMKTLARRNTRVTTPTKTIGQTLEAEFRSPAKD